jgi:two-component system CheB/CheR fusion protein
LTTLEADQDFESLLEYLRDNRGFDFTGYKRTTLVRRVSKRCTELGVDKVADYMDYLQVHSEEFALLFDKILINVTEFFRDKLAWDYLSQKVVPAIIQKGGNIRVWSAGSASGEEAYSAAIVFSEALGEDAFLQRVKIYATDVDEQALTKARAGQYSDKELESLDPKFRNQYFEPQNGRFAFRPALRRALIFGVHDLMHDAPISRLDLLICRNCLIYFTAEAQDRILTRFHYALTDDAYLFLGRAETLLTRSEMFVPADLKQRIFHKVPQREVRERIKVQTQAASTEPDLGARQHRMRELAGESTPVAQVVVDEAGTVMLVNQQARVLFNVGPGDIGRPLKDLALSYRPVDIRSPIDESLRDRRTVLISGVQHALPNGSVKHLDVQVAPLLDHDGTVAGAGVSFIDVTQAIDLRAQLDRSKQDLETSYEELQSANEELETTNEELQSTIEELETTNEELQSTNEELETMNEELESTNSELQSINSDLNLRTDEVEQFNVLLHSITGNIPLGAVVMNANLKVTVWNERAADLWGLRTEEVIGKPFFDLDIGLPTEEIRAMINEVLSGKPSHDEMVVEALNRRGTHIRCRVRASFFSDGGQSGAVVLVMEELKT